MAYYYVDSNTGTCVTDVSQSTPLTGTFGAMTASNTYASFVDLITYATGIADWDKVYFSNLHSETLGSISLPKGLELYSVDDSNADAQLFGATFIGATNHVLTIGTGKVTSIAGFDFDSSTAGYLTFSALGSRLIITNSLFQFYTGYLGFGGDGHLVTLNNCRWLATYTSPRINSGEGGKVIINTLTVEASSTLRNDSFFTVGGFGGATFEANNIDFTKILTTTAPSIIDDAPVTGDRISATFRNIKKPDTVPYIDTGTLMRNLTARVTSDTEYYNFYNEDIITGVSLNNTSKYLNYSYDGTNKSSTEMNSLNCSTGNPLRHKLAELPAQDLTSATTYTVNFVTTDATSAATLTDTEFWIEVERNDSDDQALGVIQSSRNTDILATGTTHTTNTESWTGLSADSNKYEDSLTVSGMTGVDNGTVTLYACLAEPNVDVYVDPLVVVS